METHTCSEAHMEVYEQFLIMVLLFPFETEFCFVWFFLMYMSD